MTERSTGDDRLRVRGPSAAPAVCALQLFGSMCVASRCRRTRLGPPRARPRRGHEGTRDDTASPGPTPHSISGAPRVGAVGAGYSLLRSRIAPASARTAHWARGLSDALDDAEDGALTRRVRARWACRSMSDVHGPAPSPARSRRHRPGRRGLHVSFRVCPTQASGTLAFGKASPRRRQPAHPRTAQRRGMPASLIRSGRSRGNAPPPARCCSAIGSNSIHARA